MSQKAPRLDKLHSKDQQQPRGSQLHSQSESKLLKKDCNLKRQQPNNSEIKYKQMNINQSQPNSLSSVSIKTEDQNQEDDDILQELEDQNLEIDCDYEDELKTNNNCPLTTANPENKHNLEYSSNKSSAVSEIVLSDSPPPPRKKTHPKKLMTLQFLQIAKNYFNSYSEKSEMGTTLPSIKKFADQHGYGRTNIYTLYKKWLDDPTLVSVEENIKNGAKTLRSLGPSRLTEEREEVLFKILQENPFLSVVEATEIADNDPRCQRVDPNGAISKAGYANLIRLCQLKKMRKIKLKLISSRRNTPKDIDRRKEYCTSLAKAIQAGYDVFYLDEMAINRWVTRDRVWGQENQSFANVMVRLKKESFLLVAAMNNKGSVKFEVIHGNSPKLKYQLLLDRLLMKCGERYPKNKRILVIHAAVGDQTREIMRQAGERQGYYILMLPPFSSQLNPLQSWFLQIKNMLKKQQFINDIELILATKKVINEDLRLRPLPNFYMVAQQYIKRGLNCCNF